MPDLSRVPQRSVPRLRLGPMLIDIVGVMGSAVLVFFAHLTPIRLGVSYPWLATIRAQHELAACLMLYAGLILLSLYGEDSYSTAPLPSATNQVICVGKAVLLATLLLSLFIFMSGSKSVSRFVIGFTGLQSAALLITWRLVHHNVTRRRLAEGRGVRNVLIIGAGRIGRALAHYFDEHRELGYAVKGFLDSRTPDGDPQLLGRVEELYRIARAHFIDDIFITIPSEKNLVKEVALLGRRNRWNVKLVPELYDGLAWRAPLQYAGEFPVFELHGEPIPALGALGKRLIDIVFSALALLLLSPLMLLVALMIKFDSQGPVFYRSRRVGQKGKIFTCYKYRTMVVDAEQMRSKLQHLNERQGLTFKISNDPRVTRCGRFLRKYSIDELPQLWNVLRGDMSLVGPRPPIVGEYQMYSLEHLRRLDVIPGVTGLWQVRARTDPSFDRYLNLDLEYIENWSLWLDLRILLETIPVVCRGTGQ